MENAGIDQVQDRSSASLSFYTLDFPNLISTAPPLCWVRGPVGTGIYFQQNQVAFRKMQPLKQCNPSMEKS